MANVALGALGTRGLEVLEASQGLGICVGFDLKIKQSPLYEKSTNRSEINVNKYK